MSYKVDDKKQIIYADVPKLTERDIKEIRKFTAIGYSIVNRKKEKKEKNPKFTAESIQKFLKENATKEQEKTYWEKFNAPVLDKETGKPVKYEKDTKTHKKGDIKIKGHIATLKWFKETFPDYK